MYDDVRTVAETVFQFSLYGGCTLMHLVQAQVAIHTYMKLDSYAVAYATRTQVMWFLHIWEGTDDTHDLLFRLCRQRTLREFIHIRLQQFPSHSDQHQSHNDGSQRVEHRPPAAQQDGSSDGSQRVEHRPPAAQQDGSSDAYRRADG